MMTGDRRLVIVDETPKISVEVLRERLARCADGADLVVLDPPPTIGKRLRAALIAADFVVMPFVPARESVDGLGDLMDTIEEVKHEHNPGLQVVSLLANKVNSRSGFDRKILDDLQEAAPDMLLPKVIHERTSVSGPWSRRGQYGKARMAQASSWLRPSCARPAATSCKPSSSAEGNDHGKRIAKLDCPAGQEDGRAPEGRRTVEARPR